MRRSAKPVHKCYTCLLNQGDHCWIYRYPRGQWRGGRTCRAFEDPVLYEAFRKWQKQPTVKGRKELRRDFFRVKKRLQPKRDPHRTSSEGSGAGRRRGRSGPRAP